MDDTPNPYAPPKADLGDPGDGVARKLVFSPRQGMVGTVLGGPLAGIYYVRANYIAKGEIREASSFTMIALMATAALIPLLPLLAERLPGMVLSLAYGVAVQLIIGKWQFPKAQLDESPSFAIHSNWRVAGVAGLGLAALFAFYMGLALVFPSHFLHSRS